MLGQGCEDHSIVFDFANMSRTVSPCIVSLCLHDTVQGVMQSGIEGLFREAAEMQLPLCQTAGFLATSSLCGGPEVLLPENGYIRGRSVSILFAGASPLPSTVKAPL